MFATKPAIFFKVQFIRCISLVFGCRIVFTLAFTAGEKNDFPHGLLPLSLIISIVDSGEYNKNQPVTGNPPLIYSITSVITPAPTVLPPSRMANRSSLSIAIGVISSTVQLMLSPGITISTPSASVTTPVTSVVLK